MAEAGGRLAQPRGDQFRLGRAVEHGLVTVRTHDLIDALEPGERADERPYGGGPGMVLKVEPLRDALCAARAAA